MPEVQHHASRQVDAENIDYRPVSALAVLGFLAALLSIAAFAGVVLWVVPWTAMILCILALRRIAYHDPPLAGRTLALTGLAMAIVMAVAAPTNRYVLETRSRYEATQLAGLWLEALRAGNSQQAAQFLVGPQERVSTPEDLERYYAENEQAEELMKSMAIQPVPRAITELGERATLRHVGTLLQDINAYKERIRSLWAVTYEDQGQTTSFLVMVSLERPAHFPRRVRNWLIARVDLIQQPLAQWP